MQEFEAESLRQASCVLPYTGLFPNSTPTAMMLVVVGLPGTGSALKG